MRKNITGTPVDGTIESKICTGWETQLFKRNVSWPYFYSFLFRLVFLSCNQILREKWDAGSIQKGMEEVCKDLGMSMSTAFTVFAKKMRREKRIPFEVSVDPFNSDTNMAYLKKVMAEIDSGKACGT